ncbi:MAG: hypothetical protein JSS42_08705 [Proteobacteria bacterium]|uniref:hypothetical protein n=1 Tax=Rudaea sp. TaxID=2136325 RepID=UPI00321F921C|nr:hypothetical protein [Pseudomonadota bacterium]
MRRGDVAPRFRPEQLVDARARVALARTVVDRISADAASKGATPNWRINLLSELYNLPAARLSEISAQADTLDAAHRLIAETHAAATRPASLGSASDSLVFTPMTPCRYIDTRNAGPALSPTPRVFNTSNGGTTYGGDIGCTVNSTAAPALAANVTIQVGAGPAGYVTLRPQGSPDLTSFINWPAGGTPGLANAGVIEMAPANGGGEAFEAFAIVNNVALIVDLFGYFEAAHSSARALDCTTGANTVSTVPAFTSSTFYSSCPSGYQVTGASCSPADLIVHLVASGVNTVNNFSYCTWYNDSLYTTSGNTENYAVCCRAPAY